MARQLIGTLLRTRDGRWQGQVTLPDGKRKRLPPFKAGTSKATAREELTKNVKRLLGSAQYRKLAADARLAADSRAVGRWVASWHEDRVARGLTSARDSLGHWRKHLAPILTSHPRLWRREDFRQLSAKLDAKVQRGEIAWATAKNIWNTAKGMINEACNSKSDAIRCRDDNPTEKVTPPERGESTALQYLYPSEFSQLVACEAVPIQWRRLVAVAVYTYCRAAELRALTWGDVDLEHSVISINKAVDRTSGGLKATKSKRPRRIPIEPNLRPLLQVMFEETGGRGRLLDIPHERALARGLRSCLKKAGIERAGLFTREPSTKPIRFHDLRSTGITWMAARGDVPVEIQQRAGHSSYNTTARYVRVLDAIGAFGTPFPSIPADSLRAISHTKAIAVGGLGRKKAKRMLVSSGLESADTHANRELSRGFEGVQKPRKNRPSSAGTGGQS